MRDSVRMISRNRPVLFPCIVSMIYFGLSIWLFHGRVFPPRTLRLGDWSSSGFILPWLLVGLPLTGAAAAFHSRRAGGTRGQRLFAAVFPVLAPLAVFLIATAHDLVTPTTGSAFERLRLLSAPFLSWVFFPALALAIGALPFVLRNTKM